MEATKRPRSDFEQTFDLPHDILHSDESVAPDLDCVAVVKAISILVLLPTLSPATLFPFTCSADTHTAASLLLPLLILSTPHVWGKGDWTGRNSGMELNQEKYL